MRVLSFNLWHGLSPTNVVAFEALEPSARRELRETLQLRAIAEIKPDICFFQEVNPSASRSAQFKAKLDLNSIAQPDLVGLKLFGLGFPVNLNSGLVTLTSRRFSLKKVAGVCLSRPDGLNLVSSWGSWQLKEERYALFCETLLPKIGRVLLINTHLHHGLESTPEMLRSLEKLGEELDLTTGMMSELKERLFKGNERRNQELSVLLEYLEKVSHRYEAVLLGGDLNASPEGDVAKLLRQAGFHDSWAEANPADPGYTFDSERNKANHLLQARFPLTLVLEDLSFSTRVKESLLSLARQQENRRRRIDYIWFRTNTVSLDVKAASLVGLPDQDGLAPSDHFGVCVDLDVRQSK